MITVLEGAACAGHPTPQLWDEQIDGETREARDYRHQAAKRICAGCPVRDRCAALRKGSPGVWNGKVYEGRRDACGQAEARNVGGPPVTNFCGTEAAYRRHHRRGERACDPCRRARNEAVERRKRNRARADAETRAS